MNEETLPHLIQKLKNASKECIASQITTHIISEKHAPLCLQILQELGYVPRLINHRIERRIQETDGRQPLDIDFWIDADMITLLSEHLEEEFRYLEELEIGSP